MWDISGDCVDWSGVGGTDPRELADYGIRSNSVKIQKSYLTDMEIARVLELFSHWGFSTDPSWNFRVKDGNNYVSVASTCPPKLFKEFISEALRAILDGV